MAAPQSPSKTKGKTLDSYFVASPSKAKKRALDEDIAKVPPFSPALVLPSIFFVNIDNICGLLIIDFCMDGTVDLRHFLETVVRSPLDLAPQFAFPSAFSLGSKNVNKIYINTFFDRISLVPGRKISRFPRRSAQRPSFARCIVFDPCAINMLTSYFMLILG